MGFATIAAGGAPKLKSGYTLLLAEGAILAGVILAAHFGMWTVALPGVLLLMIFFM